MGSKNRIIGMTFLALMVVLAACQGLGGEPNIVATLPANLSSSAASSASDGAASGERAEIAAIMTLGSQVWQGNCVRCHGDMGGGAAVDGTPLPDLTSLSDERILNSIRTGVRDVMPAFGDTLTAEELQAAATFAKMLSIAISRDPELAQNPAGSVPLDEAAVQPAAETIGSVVGQVTNGTADAVIPDGLALQLHVLQTEFSEVTFDATANPDGTFRFSDIPLRHEYRYVVTANYGDMMFVSDIQQGALDAAEMTLPITIYEGGADANAIQVEGVSAQVMIQDGIMQVVQIVSFVNNSDRVYFNVNEARDGGTSVGLRFPAGAEFQRLTGQTYQVSENNLQAFDTEPLIPGESRLMHVGYSLPYTDGTVFEQVFDYPIAGRFDVLLTNGGLTLTSDALATGEPITSQGMTMARYGGDLNQPAGSSVRFELNGTPAPRVPTTNASTSAPVSTSPDMRPVAYVLIGAGVSALLFAVIITIRDRRMAKSDPNASIGDLMEQIVALDSQHHAGEITEKDYTRQRAALKARLSTLMKAQ